MKRSWMVPASGRLYCVLLRLYPVRFRERFADQMLEDFEELLADDYRSHGVRGLAGAWIRVVLDASRSIPREHRSARHARRAAQHAGSAGSRSGRSGVERVHDVWTEIRLSARSLSRRPGFAVVAVVTLALAIGANTLLFSVVNGVLLRPLPYPDPDRLVHLGETREGDNGQGSQVSYPNYRDWRERSRSIETLGAMATTSSNLTGSAEPLRVEVGLATPGFMDITGLRPVLGRGFTLEEAEPGGAPVAVLSHSLWQQAFGGDPDVTGRTVALNGTAIEVIGVLPAGADFADSGALLWLPLAPMIGDWVERREVHVLTTVGRLAPAARLEEATRELDAIAAQLREEHPVANAGRGIAVRPLADAITGDVRPRVWILMASVAVVLLIACANVANLLLARLNGRRRELATRYALGASRWGVTRVFLTESLLLTLAGGVAGLGFAWVAFPIVRDQLAGQFPRAETITLDLTVLAFTLLVSVGTGLVFGLLPWFTGSGRGSVAGLRSTRGSSTAPGGAAARTTLSVLQVAGSVVLLVGAGLLMRSFVVLLNRDVGFDPSDLVTVNVSLSGAGRSTDDVIQFYRDLPERLEALPGVTSASAVNALPISGGDSQGTLTIEGRPFQPGQEPAASFRRVTPGYFATTGIPVLHGREFQGTDRGEPMIVLIAESMARRFWPDPGDALGTRIKIGPPDNEPWLTVVGVVGDVRNVGLETELRFDTYEPHAQRPWTTMSVVIRAAGDPAPIMAAVRDAIHAAGGEIPVFGASTVTDRITESLRPRRLILFLMAGFAGLALLISAVGVYGLLSWLVSQRTAEFGVRMALGARREQVRALVARQAARAIGIGLVLGLGGAALLAPAMQSMLQGVSPWDVRTWIQVPVLIAFVAALACWLPARRATAIAPGIALRDASDARGHGMR